MIDNDEFDFFPLKDGELPASSVKTTRLSTLPAEHKNYFLIDSWYDKFLTNKKKCRAENLSKYYQTTFDVDRSPVIKFIIQNLALEHPHMFTWKADLKQLHCKRQSEILFFDHDYNFVKAESAIGHNVDYVDAFDALSMQISEDLVICSLNECDNDYVSSAHLTAPSDWSAEWAIRKSFAQIHNEIKKSDGSQLFKNPSGMVKGLIRMPEPIQRVGGLSFRSNIVLNQHPENLVRSEWTWNKDQEVFLRFERQVVIPFPEIKSFLFTIKGCWANLLHPKRIGPAIQALETGNPNAHHRSFLDKEGKNLILFLRKNLNEVL